MFRNIKKGMVLTAAALLTLSVASCRDSKVNGLAKAADNERTLDNVTEKKIGADGGKRPNILFVYGDQLSLYELKAYGYDTGANTPNIDYIAEHGVRFNNSYCPTPQCSPTRSSILTGLLPHKTDIPTNMGGVNVKPLDEKFNTYGKFFKERGYLTAYFGKWHLGPAKPENLKVFGFEYAAAVSGGGEDAPKTTDALKFLDSKTDDKPWFATISFNQPHDICTAMKTIQKKRFDTSKIKLPGNIFDSLKDKPVLQQNDAKNLTEEEWKKYRAFYNQCTEEFDSNLGKVLNKLREKGEIDNTIIILSSDHGDNMGTHRLPVKGARLYEEVTKVPLIFSWPGVIPENESRNQLVESTDLFPTIAELAGFDTPEGIDGISVKGPIFDKNAKGRDSVILQYYSQKGVNVTPIRGLVKNGFKYTFDINNDEELYDLNKDKGEMSNFAHSSEYAGKKQEMKVLLLDWMEKNKDPYYKYKDDKYFRFGSTNPFFTDPDAEDVLSDDVGDGTDEED